MSENIGEDTATEKNAETKQGQDIATEEKSETIQGQDTTTEEKSETIQGQDTITEGITGKRENTRQKNRSIVLENPSWDYYIKGKGVTSSEKTPTLQKTKESSVAVGEEDKWFAENELEKPEFPYIDDDYNYATYGDNAYDTYLLELTNHKDGSVTMFDFSNFQYAEDFKEEDREFACQRICWAKAKEGILYAAISHNTYAETSPHNAYLVAIDIETGDILWKTEPLTSNSWSFALVDGGIICGYGFTAEKDTLHVVDIHDGTIKQTLPLKSMAEYIVEKDNDIYVITYNTEYIFRCTK